MAGLYDLKGGGGGFVVVEAEAEVDVVGTDFVGEEVEEGLVEEVEVEGKEEVGTCFVEEEAGGKEGIDEVGMKGVGFVDPELLLLLLGYFSFSGLGLLPLPELELGTVNPDVEIGPVPEPRSNEKCLVPLPAPAGVGRGLPPPPTPRVGDDPFDPTL